MSAEKIALYAGTRNLYADMVTAVKSLIVNSHVDQIYLMIEDDEFPYMMPDKVKFINVSNQTYFHHDGPNMHSQWTYMVLMRVALTKYFPQYSKILTLDVDTIVDHNIDDVWNLPIENYYFAAAKEPLCSKGGPYYKMDSYYNCGVVLWNLHKLREDGKDDEIIAELNTTYHPFPEQDVCNILCEGSIYDLPSKYNASDWTASTSDPAIVHYAAIREWNTFPLVQKYKVIPWESIYDN